MLNFRPSALTFLAIVSTALVRSTAAAQADNNPPMPPLEITFATSLSTSL